MDKSVAGVRLGPLLAKIRAGLQQCLESLRADLADSELPDINVHQADVGVAVLYLRDLGLKPDAARLKAEWDRCVSRCVGEWLAALADDQSEDYRDRMTECFGPFPAQIDPNDPAVFDRRVVLVGQVAQFLTFVDELTSTVNAAFPTPTVEDDSPGVVAPETAGDCKVGGRVGDGASPTQYENYLEKWRKWALSKWWLAAVFIVVVVLTWVLGWAKNIIEGVSSIFNLFRGN